MARVDTLVPREPRRTSVHARVDATYHLFERDGLQVLQIDTFGSPDRASAGTVSQSIQFSGEALALLRDLLGQMR
jgi:hypothetical protein